MAFELVEFEEENDGVQLDFRQNLVRELQLGDLDAVLICVKDDEVLAEGLHNLESLHNERKLIDKAVAFALANETVIEIGSVDHVV